MKEGVRKLLLIHLHKDVTVEPLKDERLLNREQNILQNQNDAQKSNMLSAMHGCKHNTQRTAAIIWNQVECRSSSIQEQLKYTF